MTEVQFLAVSIVHDSDHPIAVYLGEGGGVQRLTREQAETLKRGLDVALTAIQNLCPEKKAS